jgi:hypothetical protein
MQEPPGGTPAVNCPPPYRPFTAQSRQIPILIWKRDEWVKEVVHIPTRRTKR